MNNNAESSPLVIKNVRVFDGESERLEPGHVVVRGRYVDRIVPRTEAFDEPEGARVIDCADGAGEAVRVLMPGLIDAHAHLAVAGVSALEVLTGPDGLVHCKALGEAHRMLMRGFTSIRDMGGPTGAIKSVIDAGEFPGPRIYPSNAAISQTAGHGDFSAVYDAPTALGGPLSRAEQVGIMRVADGPERVLAAVREQLKRGACQVKLMAGGGVTSVYDDLDVLQFTPEELRVAVRAARDWGTYVAVHVFTTEGIRRALDAGVRSIEHGHLADEETVALIARKGAWLSTQPFAEGDHTFPDPRSKAKDAKVTQGVADLFTWAHRHDVRTAFGTDLLFAPGSGDRQSRMFARLDRYMSPVEALRIGTSGNATLLQMAGKRDPYGQARSGVVRAGAWADLLVVEGDPTRDLSLLADPERNLSVIVKDGRTYRNRFG
ncbi:MAG TPA: amidohydrolase family protein [Nocardiopsis listeri]|uniref:metal-dependent hydrolase family protein n=1 Tax=Nocardiopsis listeri TaxID=53440 RepID=UPI001D43A2D0|nr:amidohydrolase family protein [Nocardiopsis listeri]HJE59385.1 amidohydrolase family protein [Nocardiopsis listeri]